MRLFLFRRVYSRFSTDHRKGTFVQGEVISGQTTNVSGNLVSNSDAVGGHERIHVLVLTGLSAALGLGGSIEFITGPGGLGEELIHLRCF